MNQCQENFLIQFHQLQEIMLKSQTTNIFNLSIYFLLIKRHFSNSNDRLKITLTMFRNFAFQFHNIRERNNVKVQKIKMYLHK